MLSVPLELIYSSILIKLPLSCHNEYDFISLKEYYEKGTYDEYGNKMTCCCNDSSYKVVKVNFNKDNEDDYYMAWATV